MAMKQREKIAWYVLRGEIIDWLEKHPDLSVLDSIVDFEHVRICSLCGKPMCWGYCIDDGLEYYCSDKCLHRKYSKEEFDEMYKHGKRNSYYTSWID